MKRSVDDVSRPTKKLHKKSKKEVESGAEPAPSSSSRANEVEEDSDEPYDPFLHKSAAVGASSTTIMPPGDILVILDLASLEIVKSKKGEFQLLNCDDHIGLMKKFRKDPSDFRPDIIHQELMAVLDSPLNKCNRVRLLVHTEKNVLFEVNPKTRIPRTFKRFSGLMVQFLHKLKIRSADGQDMLLKVIRNPISQHLPPGAHCIGFSHHGALQSPQILATSLPSDKPIVLVFGAQATRGIQVEDHPFLTSLISISEHPLSGVVAINRVLGAIEHQYGIV
jgi:rRNA small subunit pseudouridine methyltransferase Nep1